MEFAEAYSISVRLPILLEQEVELELIDFLHDSRIKTKHYDQNNGFYVSALTERESEIVKPAAEFNHEFFFMAAELAVSFADKYQTNDLITLGKKVLAYDGKSLVLPTQPGTMAHEVRNDIVENFDRLDLLTSFLPEYSAHMTLGRHRKHEAIVKNEMFSNIVSEIIGSYVELGPPQVHYRQEVSTPLKDEIRKLARENGMIIDEEDVVGDLIPITFTNYSMDHSPLIDLEGDNFPEFWDDEQFRMETAV